jgi:hypothetical protein
LPAPGVPRTIVVESLGSPPPEHGVEPGNTEGNVAASAKRRRRSRFERRFEPREDLDARRGDGEVVAAA